MARKKRTLPKPAGAPPLVRTPRQTSPRTTEERRGRGPKPTTPAQGKKPAATGPPDPLDLAEEELLRHLPALTRAAIQKARAGRPASLLKAVRQTIREIRAAREAAARARESTDLLGPLDMQELTPFERAIIRQMRRAWHGDETALQVKVTDSPPPPTE